MGDNSKNRLQNLYGYSYQNINNASQKLRSENNNLTVAKNVIDISSQRHDKVFFFAYLHEERINNTKLRVAHLFVFLFVIKSVFYFLKK